MSERPISTDDKAYIVLNGSILEKRLLAAIVGMEDALRWLSEFKPTGDGGAEWAASVVREKASKGLAEAVAPTGPESGRTV